MKENVFKIKFKETEYPMVFNLNVMEVIQEEYGTIQKWGALALPDEKGEEPNVKALICGLTTMINEGIDIENEGKDEKDQVKPLTRKKVGRLLTELGLDDVANQMSDVVVQSLETDKSKNE